MDDPEFEEPHTKKKKSAMSPSGRGKMLFAPPKSPGNMSKICSGYVPPTTKRCTTWAVHMFDQWGEERNTVGSSGEAFRENFELLAAVVHSGF